MDQDRMPPSTSLTKCCDCDCECSLMDRSYYGTWLRSVKRKFDEFDEDNKSFHIPGLEIPRVARVEIGNECVLLREMVSNQQQTIQELSFELEEERNAASTAASEAMSMILRLQSEKAEIQMEARQFKLFSEEKMAHDQQEIMVLEDLLYKREQAIQSLTCQKQAYKHKMLSYGLSEAEVEGILGRSNSVDYLDGGYDSPTYNYPPIKCTFNENQRNFGIDDEQSDVEKYPFDETPRSRDRLKDLEFRINQLERSPRHSLADGESSGTGNVLEKVIVGYSPRKPKHSRNFSTDSGGSFGANIKEMGPDPVSDSPKFSGRNIKMDRSMSGDFSDNAKKMDNSSDVGDDLGDRVYTIDAIHNGVSYNAARNAKASVGVLEDNLSTPRESLRRTDVGDPDITKLYMRLQALEADRESMRQALISMRTDKAQLVLLKEIAQHLCKDNPPARSIAVKKPSIIASFSFFTIFKWVTSFLFWKKRAGRSKYLHNLSTNNPGLRMLLDKGPRVGQWRCLSSTQV